MAFESVTDELIQELLKCSKRVLNPKARRQVENECARVTYQLESIDRKHKFKIFLRQNLRPDMTECFSVGLRWILPSGDGLTLTRYNGNKHEHLNDIEKEKFEACFHIHIATERYIRANKTPEKYAVPSDRFKSVEGALHCLVVDCNITGLNTKPDNMRQMSLFS